jgi:hypothetical protein
MGICLDLTFLVLYKPPHCDKRLTRKKAELFKNGCPLPIYFISFSQVSKVFEIKNKSSCEIFCSVYCEVESQYLLAGPLTLSSPSPSPSPSRPLPPPTPPLPILPPSPPYTSSFSFFFSFLCFLCVHSVKKTKVFTVSARSLLGTYSYPFTFQPFKGNVSRDRVLNI